MATFNFTGFAADAFSSPGGSTIQLDPGWDAQDDGYDFEITDDDTQFQGDAVENETGDDTSQSGVVRDETGAVVASGQTYLEEAYVLTDDNGNTIRLYSVEIGGVLVGYIADGPIQPGVSYNYAAYENVTNSNAPEYSSIEDQSYDEDAANNINGSDNNDTLTSDSGADSIDAGGGNDQISSGQGSDTVHGGDGNDTIDSRQQDGSNSSDADYVDGGAGNDSITGSEGDDTLLGGSGQDTILGAGGNDSIEGGSGDDSIDGGDGNDLIRGGDNTDDTITGSIGTDNYNQSGQGYTVSAQNVESGALTAASTANVATSGGGLGATGAVSSTDSGQNNQLAFDKASGLSERLIVEFDDNVTSASFSFQSLFTDGFGEVGHWEIYDDGVLVAQSDFTESTTGSGSGTIDLSGFGEFDTIVFSANLQTDGTDGSDYVVTDISFTMPTTVSSDDTISGGDGSDTIFGGTGEDSISGGAGDDYIEGGANVDYIEGGAGNDTIDGGNSTDTVYGGAGDDLITDSGGALSDDTIYGEAGSDTIAGGVREDYLDGGDDDDTFLIEDNFGSDTIVGGEGGVDSDTIDLSNLSGPVTVTYTGDEAGTITDGTSTLEFSQVEKLILTDHADVVDATADTSGVHIEAGDGNDTIEYGQGDSTVLGGAGNDLIDDQSGVQHSGSDNIDGGEGNDTIWSGGGADTLQGGDGNDLLYGEDGNDIIEGGSGDDTLTGGGGNDSLSGDGGNDTFTYVPGDGDDTITDFNTGNTGTLNDGDSTNNDFIDLSGYYDNLSELYADQADDGVLNQSNATDSKGRSTDYSDNTQFGSGSLRMQGASADNSSFTQENTGVVCFTQGTAIRTPRGDRLIEDLRVGDLVCTLDNGPQVIRWIGRRALGPSELAANPKLRPILIRRGVMGAERDLLVSPQHGMLLPDQTLVRAKFLAEAKGAPVRVAHGRQSVTYIHLLFEQHQIIFAENTRSESLYPGKMAFAAMDRDARLELAQLFPDLGLDQLDTPEEWYGAAARRYLKRKTALQRGGARLLVS